VRHIFSGHRRDAHCLLFLELNACVSAGFAAEQTVRLRMVDDQKAVIATVEAGP